MALAGQRFKLEVHRQADVQSSYGVPMLNTRPHERAIRVAPEITLNNYLMRVELGTEIQIFKCNSE